MIAIQMTLVSDAKQITLFTFRTVTALNYNFKLKDDELLGLGPTFVSLNDVVIRVMDNHNLLWLEQHSGRNLPATQKVPGFIPPTLQQQTAVSDPRRGDKLKVFR